MVVFFPSPFSPNWNQSQAALVPCPRKRGWAGLGWAVLMDGRPPSSRPDSGGAFSLAPFSPPCHQCPPASRSLMRCQFLQEAAPDPSGPQTRSAFLFFPPTDWLAHLPVGLRPQSLHFPRAGRTRTPSLRPPPPPGSASQHRGRLSARTSEWVEEGWRSSG